MDSKGKIRERTRSIVVECRLASREQALKIKRKALNDVLDIGRDVKEGEVTILANKLKSKSLVQAEDLALLKIAFVQRVHNIVTFLKVKGALQGLVRELSSAKPKFELLAAECVCNLALGDAKSCFVVAKAAGPYLITILSSFNNNLMATSVWALGNLVGSDEKTWKIVHSQGFLIKLLQLILENDNLPDLRQELMHNSLTALSQLLRVGAGHLTVEEMEATTKTLVNLKNSSCKGLTESLYLLSCMEAAESELIKHHIHLKCLEAMVKDELTADTVLAFTACVRITANLIAESSGFCALEVLKHWDYLQEITKKISTSTYTHLRLEFGWVLGNIANHSSAQVQTEVVNFSTHFQLYESKCLYVHV